MISFQNISSGRVRSTQLERITSFGCFPCETAGWAKGLLHMNIVIYYLQDYCPHLRSSDPTADDTVVATHQGYKISVGRLSTRDIVFIYLSYQVP